MVSHHPQAGRTPQQVVPLPTGPKETKIDSVTL
jgi:hypothetical protein